MKPRIVLSGVNLVEAGPLAVFKDALEELSSHFLDSYDVFALVHRRELFTIPGIRILELPTIKSSWLRRLYFEYVACRALSKRLKAHLWLSMHDITPNATATLRAVYCHNPAPFYRLSLREAMLDWTFAIFHLFYRSLYRINIAKNTAVIVQQQWLRVEFCKSYPVRNVVVAHPSLPSSAKPQAKLPLQPARTDTAFFYPAYPRCFKNVEVLLRAAEILEAAAFVREPGSPGFEIWLTIAGHENRYAASLLHRFKQLASVRWLGFQSRSRVEQLYAEADCLVFPSRLESWGMPLSEFKPTGKQIIVADLAYAHETLGTYDRAYFVPATDATLLARAMEAFLLGKLQSTPTMSPEIAQPFAPGWRELFDLLLDTSPPQRQPIPETTDARSA